MNLADHLFKGKEDLEIDLVVDLSAKQYRAIAIDTGMLGLTLGSALVPPLRLAGILQNAPVPGQVARVRFIGWSQVVYGDTVTEGDLLKTEPTTPYDRLVKFDMGHDGHTHASGAALMESMLVRVTDLKGDGVTGLDDTNIIARQWYLDGGGNVTEEMASTSVLEATSADGWYVIATTAITNVNLPHRLSIEADDPLHHFITPGEHPWTPRYSSTGVPAATTYTYCLGQALTGGVADDIGLAILRPQIF